MTTPAQRAWSDLPGALNDEVERVLGSAVQTFVPVAGVFSDGVIGTVTSRLEARLFVKAVPAESEAVADYRLEARIATVLPSSVPTPRLLLVVDGFGWVLLGFEAVVGRTPGEPWRVDELEGALDALTAFACDPSTKSLAEVPTVAQRMAGRCNTWRDLLDHGCSGPLQTDQLGPWERRHLPRLAELEDDWTHRVAGDVLLHFDLRHDNFLITTSGKTVIVDWGRASYGPSWVDLVCLLLESDLGPLKPEEIFEQHPLGRAAEPSAVDGLLVALGSYWTQAAARPAPPATQALRLRQENSRRATMRWLQQRWS